MVLFNGISGILGKVGGVVGAPTAGGAIRTLNRDDFASPNGVGGSVGTITCAALKWTRVGTYTIESQAKYNIGIGRSGIQNSNQGILFATFSASAADVHGYMRAYFANNEDRVLMPYILNKLSTRRTNKDLADGNDKVYWLPLQTNPTAQEDDRIVLEFMPEGTGSQDIDGVTLRIDFTKTEVR